MEIKATIEITNLDEFDDHINKAKALADLLANEQEQINAWRPNVVVKGAD